jgi:hypothetical protein
MANDTINVTANELMEEAFKLTIKDLPSGYKLFYNERSNAWGFTRDGYNELMKTDYPFGTPYYHSKEECIAAAIKEDRQRKKMEILIDCHNWKEVTE